MANDFSTSPECVAVYNFENGALTADSSGNGNALTASVSPPTADTVNHKQGAASADFELDSSQDYQRADADLSSGFPMKNGTANRTFTVTCWLRPESVSGSYYSIPWSKGPTYLRIYNNASQGFLCNFQFSSSSPLHPNPNSTPVAGRWYFIACGYRESDDYRYIYVWDDTAAAWYSASSSTPVAPDLVCDASIWGVGRVASPSSLYKRWDGNIDELTVWNRLLTEDEINDIKDGTFTGSSSSSSSSSASSSSSSPSSSSSSDSSSSSFVPLTWPTLSKGVEFDTQELPGAHDVTMPLGHGQTKIRPRYTRRPHRWRIRYRLLTLQDRMTLERFWLVECKRSKYTFEFVEKGMNQTWLVRFDPDEPAKFEHEERCPGKYRFTAVLLEDCAGEYGSGHYGAQYYDS